jgi:mannose-6-phosphate isomerase-like protein (cupin superfamily)
MSDSNRSRVVRFAEARGQIPGPAGEHWARVIRRGTLDVKLSAPAVPTQQTPHEQDEIYVVVRGHGVLLHDGRRDAFEAGDLLFVAAGVEHQVEDISEDLAVWVVFYGPPGGEV